MSYSIKLGIALVCLGLSGAAIGQEPDRTAAFMAMVTRDYMKQMAECEVMARDANDAEIGRFCLDANEAGYQRVKTFWERKEIHYLYWATCYQNLGTSYSHDLEILGHCLAYTKARCPKPNANGVGYEECYRTIARGHWMLDRSVR